MSPSEDVRVVLKPRFGVGADEEGEEFDGDGKVGDGRVGSVTTCWGWEGEEVGFWWWARH